MPKFVARERKHRRLAKAKDDARGGKSNVDTNALEHVSPGQVDIEEKKRQIKARLNEAGQKVSSQKAKRLQKYIENKLKKDENRALIERLANLRTNTSFLQSSKTLGNSQHLQRQLARRRETRADDVQDAESSGDDALGLPFPKGIGNGAYSQAQPSLAIADGLDIISVPKVPAPAYETSIDPSERRTTIGAGLKRRLETDAQGDPILKKRRTRGGVKSKFLLRKQMPENSTELEWDGFSTSSEDLADATGSTSEGSASSDDESLDDNDQPNQDDSSSSSDGQDEAGSESDSGDSGDSDDDEVDPAQRSSAFKAWANAQLGEAHGLSTSDTHTEAIHFPTIEGFQPRPMEVDPLPPELLPTDSSRGEVFSVNVERPAPIQESRMKLPVVVEEQKIMEAVHNHNAIIVHGATGSGKTTQVPQFLFEAGYGSPDSRTPGMIGITQPRRVAAVSMSKRVAEELGGYGDRVAYQIRFEGTVNPRTAVKFMTDGVLLREVAQDIALRKYSAIIIDEAHERTVNTDILIGMLSRVVKLRAELATEDSTISPLKLIIMSATLRVSDFTKNENLFTVPPPILHAEGRQYNVVMHFARRTHHDYLEDAFRKISKGHRKLPPGTFLVFLTGQGEISQLSKKLGEAFSIAHTGNQASVRAIGRDVPLEIDDLEYGTTSRSERGTAMEDENEELDIDLHGDDDKDFEVGEDGALGPPKMRILPLYSLLPTHEQLKVFEPPPEGSRLVVLATNVAETSLTIPGVRFVFDCGRSKERRYDPLTGVQTFEIGWISKASADQRAGRAGRTGPGHCYRLYSSAVFERDFDEHADPEILRTPIEGVVLQLKAMNLQHVVNFPFPTPPEKQSLAEAERLLTYLSALSPKGAITSVGSTMSIFPLAPRFARILLVGHLHGCLHYTIAMVAGLSGGEVFVPEHQAISISMNHLDVDDQAKAAQTREQHGPARQMYNEAHRNFCFLDDKSDAIKLLQVVGEFAHEPTEAWCRQHYVRYKTLREISQLRRQLTDLMRNNVPEFAGLSYADRLDPPTAKQVKALKQMVAAGFIDHVAMRADLHPNPPEVTQRSRRAIEVPYLTLFPSRLPADLENKCVYIHPASPLAHLSHKECPDFIIYAYLQRASASVEGVTPKTRMHALTDITGGQLAALAKGTPMLQYGKPIKVSTSKAGTDASVRECWAVPYLRGEADGLGWPLPARKVVQRKVPGQGWVVE